MQRVPQPAEVRGRKERDMENPMRAQQRHADGARRIRDAAARCAAAVIAPRVTRRKAVGKARTRRVPRGGGSAHQKRALLCFAAAAKTEMSGSVRERARVCRAARCAKQRAMQRKAAR